MKPTLVILAAGASRRLGTCKALVELPGGTPLERLLAAGRWPGCDPVLVTGPDHDLLARAAPPEVELVRNAQWRVGRSGSVSAAQAARPGRDLVIAPVDVPCVPASVFTALLGAWEDAQRPERGWLAPAVEMPDGRRFGHPVVLGRTLARELVGWEPGRPLFELRGQAEPLWSVTVQARAVLDDLDTPADLDRLRRELAGAARDSD